MTNPKASGSVNDKGAPRPNPAPPLAVPPAQGTPRPPATSGTSTRR